MNVSLQVRNSRRTVHGLSYSPLFGLGKSLALCTQQDCWLIRTSEAKSKRKHFSGLGCLKTLSANLGLIFKTISRLHRSIVFMVDNLIFPPFNFLPIFHTKVNISHSQDSPNHYLCFKNSISWLSPKRKTSNQYAFLLCFPQITVLTCITYLVFHKLNTGHQMQTG